MNFSRVALLFLCTNISVLLFSQISQGEPWLANRYSKNCAACHSPGRINRESKKRRCTLSCQGCHVNPNGGGMRNHYGKWNSQRWLRSFKWKKWHHGKSTPMPREYQPYAKLYPKSVAPQKVYSKKRKRKSRRSRKRRSKKLVLSKNTLVNEKLYDKYADTGWRYNAKSDKEFYKFLSSMDPYYTEKRNRVTTNAEVRHIFLLNSGDQSPGVSTVGFREDSSNGFMAMDVGIRLRPSKKHFSFVFEHRYLNSPSNSEVDALFVSGISRSAYILVDELPYNTYVMGGLYRPMFGHQNPNHRALREVIAFGYVTPGASPSARFGGSASARYEGIGIGTAPNVPFFNVNLLTKGVDGLTDGSSGFVANTGLRFVTLGASIVASYWATSRENSSGGTLDKTMFSLTAGMNVGRLTLNGELLNFEEEFAPGLKNEGSVITAEGKFKVWKEAYLTFGYALGNTSRTQAAGDSSDLTVGVKFFPLAGLEMDLSYWLQTNRDESGPTPVDTDWNSIQLQTHLYF